MAKTRKFGVRPQRRPQRRSQWTEQDVDRILANPLYPGTCVSPRIATDEMWIKAMQRLIAEKGAVHVLELSKQVLGESLAPIDYNIPAWMAEATWASDALLQMAQAGTAKFLDDFLSRLRADLLAQKAAKSMSLSS